MDGTGIFDDGEIYFMPLSVTAAQTAANITLQMNAPDGNLMQTALYADNGSGQPGAFLGVSNAVPVSSTGAFTMDIGGGGLTLAPGTVWLAFIGTGGTGSYTLTASAEQEIQFRYLDTENFPPSNGSSANPEGGDFDAVAVDLNGCAATPTVTPTAVCYSWSQYGVVGAGDAVAVDASGDVIATGSQYIPTGYDVMRTVKYSADGTRTLWTQNDSSGGTQGTSGNGVAVDGLGNVVVTGISYVGGTGVMHTVKYSSDGTQVLWTNNDSSGAPNATGGFAVAIDGSGNVIVTGSSFIGGETVMHTVKYSADGSQVLWTRNDNSGGVYGTSGVGVAVDGSGNVIVVGNADPSYLNTWHTVKYSADGTRVLWTQNDSSGGSKGTYATGVAVDGSDNVAVTGHAYIGGLYVMHTVKYSADGTQILWTQNDNYGNVSTNPGVGGGVAFDGSGNVVATGNLSAPGGLIHTVKYSADGTQVLWTNNDSSGIGQGVSVDGSGNVIVCGGGSSGGQNAMYTVSYGCPP